MFDLYSLSNVVVDNNRKTLEQNFNCNLQKSKIREPKSSENPLKLLKDHINSNRKEQKSKSCFASFASYIQVKTQVIKKDKTLDVYSTFAPFSQLAHESCLHKHAVV